MPLNETPPWKVSTYATADNVDVVSGHLTEPQRRQGTSCHLTLWNISLYSSYIGLHDYLKELIAKAAN